MQLNYETKDPPPQTVQFAADNNRHTLTFPVTPAWLIFVAIGILLAMAVMKLVLFICIVWMFGQFVYSPQPIWNSVLLIYPIISLLWALVAWWMFRNYRRHGHIPRILWIDTTAQTLGHRNERTTRIRQWPSKEILQIRVKKIRSLRGVANAHLLKIRIKGRAFPLRFRCPVEQEAALHSFLNVLIRIIPAANRRLPIEFEPR